MTRCFGAPGSRTLAAFSCKHGQQRAPRKDIGANRDFEKKMQYSEDDETRVVRAGLQRRLLSRVGRRSLAPNYTPREELPGSYGEAGPLAAVWTGTDPGRSALGGTHLRVGLGLNDLRKGFAWVPSCQWDGSTIDPAFCARIRWQQRRAARRRFHEGGGFSGRPGFRVCSPRRAIPHVNSNLARNPLPRGAGDGSAGRVRQSRLFGTLNGGPGLHLPEGEGWVRGNRRPFGQARWNWPESPLKA